MERKQVGITHEGKTEVLPALSLSEGGLYIKTPSPLSPGTELDIILPMEDQSPLHLSGRVVYLDIPTEKEKHKSVDTRIGRYKNKIIIKENAKQQRDPSEH